MGNCNTPSRWSISATGLCRWSAEAGRQVAIAYHGDTTDPAFRQEVYADLTTKAGVPRICVPAAAITKDALAVRIDKQSGRVVIYPMGIFGKWWKST